MTVVEHISEYVIHRVIAIDPLWGIIFAVSTVIYLTIRFLAKRTNVLNVEGR
jgi:hypothetical protein